jgi:hypothetical protein
MVACFASLPALSAFAWLYPEHRNVTLLAIEMLTPEQRLVLENLWSAARAGFETRLCTELAYSTQGLKPRCIDYGAWPAIGGDHSCSAREMLDDVLHAPWILDVAAIGATLNTKLATSTRREQRANALRRSDIEFLRADRDYASRAQSNSAHFLLVRPNVALEPQSYARLALGPTAKLNAVATYSSYHMQALVKAARFAGDLPPEARSRVALSVLADEAFALHFLEDSFAAGHVAGNWGNTALRLGTHDYYNEHGLEVTTWKGNRFVTLGDAYMRPEDARHTALAVRDSLAQVVAALNGELQVESAPDNPGNLLPEAFDVCQQSQFHAAAVKDSDIQILIPVIMQTPVPALGDVAGQLPRFRAELGPFIGTSAAALVGASGEGFGSNQTGASALGGLEVAVRMGIGLEGVLDDSGDGLVFAGVGLRQDSPTTGVANIPGRGAINVSLRVPFWLIPGDIVLAAPLLKFTSPRTLKSMAVQAGNGGWVPWQAGIATRIGRFQFVLGREAALNFYRFNTHTSVVLPTPHVAPFNRTLVALSSIQVDFPIVEYRPFRSFSRNQSSSVLVQAYVGFDTPMRSEVVSPPGAPMPPLRTVVLTGIRVAFDWRHYLK